MAARPRCKDSGDLNWASGRRHRANQPVLRSPSWFSARSSWSQAQVSGPQSPPFWPRLRIGGAASPASIFPPCRWQAPIGSPRRNTPPIRSFRPAHSANQGNDAPDPSGTAISPSPESPMRRCPPHRNYNCSTLMVAGKGLLDRKQPAGSDRRPIARPRDEARDRVHRVDDVWVPDSTKEDLVSAGRRSLRHDEQEFSCAYSMALSGPRPELGWADAACAPAAEQG